QELVVLRWIVVSDGRAGREDLLEDLLGNLEFEPGGGAARRVRPGKQVCFSRIRGRPEFTPAIIPPCRRRIDAMIQQLGGARQVRAVIQADVPHRRSPGPAFTSFTNSWTLPTIFSSTAGPHFVGMP